MKELKHESDYLAARARELVVGHRRGIFTEQPVAAAVGRIEKADNVQERGLTGTGWTHYRKVFARRYLKGDVAQGMHDLLAYRVLAKNTGQGQQEANPRVK